MLRDAFTTWLVELDFDTKVDRRIEIGDLPASLEAGKFVWLDLHIHDVDRARVELTALDLMNDEVLDEVLSGETGTQHARYPRHLHMVLTGLKLVERDLELDRFDLVVREDMFITVHHDDVRVLDAVKRDYREDFLHHAKTPSFLIYEMWDHLLDSYVIVQDRLEDVVEELEQALIGDVDDNVFRHVAELGSDLLHFRKVLMPARAVLTDLSSRKSRFISEATQPFLANMVGRVERILQDVLVAREILANSVNLYMSVVGHRTNEVMRRLTVVSVVFLPLTFLVGVYGMNFDHQPELHWDYGYAAFWVLTGLIAGGLIYLMTRKRLL